MKRWLIFGLVGAILVGAIVSAVLLLPRESPKHTTVNKVPTSQQTEETSTPQPSAVALATGRYEQYSQQELASEGYDTSILFFHAPWCIECRGFEMAIKDSTIPAGTQILKVDYDSSTDLRKQYGVTIQSTFVRVNSDGAKQSTWVGYGKDKTVDAIIKNTQ